MLAGALVVANDPAMWQRQRYARPNLSCLQETKKQAKLFIENMQT